MLPQASRAFRDLYEGCESTAVPEAVPFLKDSSQQQSLDLDPSDLEGGISDPSGAKGPRACLESLSCSDSDDETSNSFDSLSASSHLPRWQWRKRIRKLYWVLIGTKTNTATRGEKLSRRPRRRAASLRRVVRIFAFLLMLLYILLLSFFVSALLTGQLGASSTSSRSLVASGWHSFRTRYPGPRTCLPQAIFLKNWAAGPPTSRQTSGLSRVPLITTIGGKSLFSQPYMPVAPVSRLMSGPTKTIFLLGIPPHPWSQLVRCAVST